MLNLVPFPWRGEIDIAPIAVSIGKHPHELDRMLQGIVAETIDKAGRTPADFRVTRLLTCPIQQKHVINVQLTENTVRIIYPGCDSRQRYCPYQDYDIVNPEPEK